MACCILYRGDVVPKDINGKQFYWLFVWTCDYDVFLHSDNLIIKSKSKYSICWLVSDWWELLEKSLFDSFY